MSSRITVIDRVSGRRYWTVEQKLAMLRDAFGPGGCVRRAMDLHEVSSGQLYTWRRQAMSGELSGKPPVVPVFAQVRIADPGPAVPALAPPMPPPLAARSGSVEPTAKIGIELPSGIRLTVDSGVDADALRRVLSVIGQ
jgi:transposase